MKELDVASIAADDCILFMRTAESHTANSIELCKAWGFEYKTVAFVWDKQVNNPGRYRLSQTELALAFKKSRSPTPRGARNVRQLVSIYVAFIVQSRCSLLMASQNVPTTEKIELFARKNYCGWDNRGV